MSTRIFKSCPNCGAYESQIVIHHSTYGGVGKTSDTGAYVQCLKCGVAGPWSSTYAEAIRGWNKLPRFEEKGYECP